MIASVVIIGVALAAIAASVSFFPSFRIGKISIGTYWVIALVCAVVLLAAKLVPAKEVLSGLTASGAINPLKILALFFSMTFLSVYLDEAGLFRALARRAAAKARSSQVRLFVIVFSLTALLTVFTSNDVVILTLTPFLCFFCKNTDVDPVPYLVGEFAAANTFSMALIIGNPTNIYLATSAGVGFAEYFKIMSLPTVAAGIVEFAILFLLFHKKLQKPLAPQADDFTVKSKADVVIGVAHLAVTLVFLAVGEYVGVEMWLVSVVAAGSLLLCSVVTRFVKKDGWGYVVDTFKRLPWQLVPFVLSMFVIVICLRYRGVTDKLGAFLGNKACIWTYGGASYLTANLINNIPMSMLFSELPVRLSRGAYLQATYASVVGSNVGAFLTPIGALAGIMFTGLTEKYEVRFGFRRFLLYGVLVSLPTLAATLAVLAAFL